MNKITKFFRARDATKVFIDGFIFFGFMAGKNAARIYWPREKRRVKRKETILLPAEKEKQSNSQLKCCSRLSTTQVVTQ